MEGAGTRTSLGSMEAVNEAEIASTIEKKVENALQ